MTFTPYFGTGFEVGHIGIIAATNYNRASISTTTVKTGTYSLMLDGTSNNGAWARFAHSGAYLDVAAWVYAVSSTYMPRIEAVLADGNVVDVRFATTGWKAYVDAALVASGTVAVALNTWHHVQVRFFIDNAGYIKTKVDGIDDIDYSGDTQPGASAAISYARMQVHAIASASSDAYIDNFVYGTGDWPGDIRFDGLVPNGDSSVQWTPSTETDNYALVDERPPSDVDYVSTGSLNYKDLYTLGDWSGTGKTPQFVMAWHRAWKDAAGDRSMSQIISSGGTESSSGSFALATSGTYYWKLFATEPSTGSTWTDATIDGLLLGQEAF